MWGGDMYNCYFYFVGTLSLVRQVVFIHEQ